MKRIMVLMLAFALILSMIACSNTKQDHTHNNDINTETQETIGSEDTTSTTQSVEKDEQNITASVIIRRVNADLAKDNLDPISNIEIKKGAEEGQEVTSFVCVNGLVTVNVTEIGGIVNYVMALCLPAQVMQKIPSKSLTEAAIGAYAYCMIPLFSCEPQIDSSWHQEQFANAPDEGDSSVVIRSYTSGEWLYTAMIAETYVTCIANRYCNQCKNNAPKVSFTLGAKVCDACNNQSNNDASFDSDNTSQPSATQPPVTQPPTTQPSVTQPPATQAPTVCSHNYATATCTTPKTCTLCGQTSGSALGHTYSAATCTTPQTCNTCGATTGSAAGHTWKNATCTEPATCTTCQETWGSANGHSWREATCSAPKTCQTCKTTEGSALPHNLYYTKCSTCDHTDFSQYTLSSNTFCLDSWFDLGDGSGSHYLEDGEASINIDSNGVCKVTFDKYSYTFTLVQSEVDVYGLHFKCYMNGAQVKNTEITFFFSQNRCDFFNYGDTLGFSQVALNFDM